MRLDIEGKHMTLAPHLLGWVAQCLEALNTPDDDNGGGLAQATVVIDCTADRLGLVHKRDWYEHLPNAQGFIVQGSETG